MSHAVRVTVELPEQAGGESNEKLSQRLRLLWVLDEVRQGRMTRMRAAKELDLPIDAFLEAADLHGVYAFDHEPDDLTPLQ